MFFVWDATGVQRPYLPTAPQSMRRVDQLAAAEAVRGKGRADRDAEERERQIQSYERVQNPPRDREPALLAKQLMSSPVVSIRSDASMSQAESMIRKHEFRHLPVVNADASLVGILSERDLFRKAATTVLSERKGITVSALMATDVLTARTDASIRDIARVMFEERVGAMPLTDEQGTLEGILTRSDILRALVFKAPLELWI